MESFLKNILSFDHKKQFSNREVVKQFEQWDQHPRQKQMALMLLLTAFLYLGFNFIDKPWVADDLETVIFKLFITINIPVLLLVSFMAFKKFHQKIVMLGVALSPIVCAGVHIYVSNLIEGNSIFLTEGYLIVLWIFILSGLTFIYALMSASIVALMLIISGQVVLSEPDTYSMYVYWIFCSFAFGVLGALILDRSRKAVFFSQHELQKLAETDTLTGLFNRSVFDRVITSELAKSKDSNCQFGLILVDVDDFKLINDTFGHKKGDQVLRLIASTLSDMMDENCTLVRWGGEEFAVMIGDTSERELSEVCERIREGIERDPFGVNNPITVSVGATLSRKKDTQDAMLIRADKALYEAKGNGRNRSVIKV